MTLEELGWTPRSRRRSRRTRRKAMSRRASRWSTRTSTASCTPDDEQLARVSGRLRHDAVGARGFSRRRRLGRRSSRPETGRDARIRAVLPRATPFSRRAAGNPTEEQVVAANIDIVFLVSGLDHDFNPRRIERYLVTAWDSGAAPVIVLNKADLVDDPGAIVGEVEVARARGAGARGVGEDARVRLTALRVVLAPGRTAALLGSSGVGKSSIANALIGEEVLRTREVRESDSRGRHTTTGRQLVLLPGGGILIDTPGMRELQLWEAGESVAGAFADIERSRPAAAFATAATRRSRAARWRRRPRTARCRPRASRASASCRTSRPTRPRSRTSAPGSNRSGTARSARRRFASRLKDKGRT